jgi:hypothetical protein
MTIRLSSLAVAVILATGVPAAGATAPPSPAIIDAATAPAAIDPAGLDPAIFARARLAFERVRASGRHAVRPVLAVIDYSQPSTARRLWVFDVDSGALLHHELVAHGKGTGGLQATRFSNRHGSHQSSLGTFVVGDAYRGKHGRSLRLHGLDDGLNDNALARAVVIHAADYVSDAVVKAQGRLGRSWGCPALDPAVADDVMDTLKDGAVLVAWHRDQPALLASPWLRPERLARR